MIRYKFEVKAGDVIQLEEYGRVYEVVGVNGPVIEYVKDGHGFQVGYISVFNHWVPSEEL